MKTKTEGNKLKHVRKENDGREIHKRIKRHVNNIE
jgi:hypothetical protein